MISIRVRKAMGVLGVVALVTGTVTHVFASRNPELGHSDSAETCAIIAMIVWMTTSIMIKISMLEGSFLPSWVHTFSLLFFGSLVAFLQMSKMPIVAWTDLLFLCWPVIDLIDLAVPQRWWRK